MNCGRTSFIAVNPSDPHWELFIWSVFFGRMSLSMFFWKECPNQLGTALVANSVLKSLSGEAKSAKKRQLSEELDSNAALVDILYC